MQAELPVAILIVNIVVVTILGLGPIVQRKGDVVIISVLNVSGHMTDSHLQVAYAN